MNNCENCGCEFEEYGEEMGIDKAILGNKELPHTFLCRDCLEQYIKLKLVAEFLDDEFDKNFVFEFLAYICIIGGGTILVATTAVELVSNQKWFLLVWNMVMYAIMLVSGFRLFSIAFRQRKHYKKMKNTAKSIIAEKVLKDRSM